MWENVLFSDESHFYEGFKKINSVRRPVGSNRFDPKYLQRTKKHPGYVMVWGCFSGKGGRGRLNLLERGTRMNAVKYISNLTEYMLPTMEIHDCQYFLQDKAPCHTAKVVKKFFIDNNINIIDWPGNSPDINPIENLWASLKRQLQNENTSSVPHVIESLKKIWIKETTHETCLALAHSMPRRLQNVISANGEMTKY